MRILHLIFAAFLLLSGAAASACHAVGDVHVICHDGKIEALYVESEMAEDAATHPECCPMAGFALPVAAIAATHQAPLSTAKFHKQPDMHKLRSDTHAVPRGPPSRLLF
ncbi:MAG: Uncharacterised protein [Alphaproteobacteria bacterium]|nr:MAG: Uncharacterised protein [Alphaproteobacteria bacterium]